MNFWDNSLNWISFAAHLLILILPAYYLAGRRFLISIPILALALNFSGLVSWLLGVYSLYTIGGSLLLIYSLFYLLKRWGGFFPTPAPASASSSGFVWESRATKAAAALLLGAILLGLLMNLRTVFSGWDAMTYHLETPLSWISQGYIHQVQTYYGDYSPAYYPGFSWFWYGWFLLSRGGAILADATHFFWIFVLWGSLRGVLYHYHGTPEMDEASPLPEFGAILGVSMPYMMSSALFAENDLMLAAWFTLTLHFYLRYRYLSIIAPERVPGEALIPGLLSAGFMVAVKYTGLVYFGGLVIFVLLDLLLNREAKRPLRPAEWAAMPVLLMVSGGFWYLKNWIQTGNPLYPGQIELVGLVIFSGFYTPEFQKSHAFYEFHFKSFFSDPGFFLVLAPFLMLGPLRILHFLRDGRGHVGKELVVFLAPFIFFALFYFFVPYRHHRLMGPFFLILLPGITAACRALMPKGLEKWVYGVFLAALSVNLLVFTVRLAELYHYLLSPQFSLTDFSRGTLKIFPGSMEEVLTYVVVLVILAGLIYAIHSLRKRHLYKLLFALCPLLLLWFAPMFQRMVQHRYIAGYESSAWAWVDSNLSPDVSLALVGSNAVSALRGPRGQRKVELMNSWPRGERLLHKRYPPQKLWERVEYYKTHPQKEVFFKRLQKDNIQGVVVTQKRGEASWHEERHWLRENPGNWRPCFVELSVEVYCLKSRVKKTYSP